MPLLGYMVVARTLGRQGFGQLGMVQNTVGMLGTFAGFGFGITATTYLARYRETNPSAAGRVLALTLGSATIISFIVAALLWANASYVARSWLCDLQMTACLEIGSILLVLYCINGVQVAAYAGLEAFREMAIVAAWSSGLSLASVVGAFWGVQGAIWSLVLSALLNCVVAGFVFHRVARRKGITLVWARCWSERSTLFTSSLPATLSNILYTPVFWFCSTLLVALPNGYQEMGVFSAANQWRSVALVLPAILSQTLIPIVAESCAAGRRSESVRLLWRVFKLLALIGIPSTVLLMLLSKTILIAYGPEFTGGWLAFCFLQSAVLLQILQSPAIKYMEANGLLWLNFGFNLLQAAVMVGATYVLVHRGATGLAAGVFCSFAVHSVSLGAFALRLRTSISSDDNNSLDK